MSHGFCCLDHETSFQQKEETLFKWWCVLPQRNDSSLSPSITCLLSLLMSCTEPCVSCTKRAQGTVRVQTKYRPLFPAWPVENSSSASQNIITAGHADGTILLKRISKEILRRVSLCDAEGRQAPDWHSRSFSVRRRHARPYSKIATNWNHIAPLLHAAEFWYWRQPDKNTAESLPQFLCSAKHLLNKLTKSVQIRDERYFTEAIYVAKETSLMVSLVCN